MIIIIADSSNATKHIITTTTATTTLRHSFKAVTGRTVHFGNEIFSLFSKIFLKTTSAEHTITDLAL